MPGRFVFFAFWLMSNLLLSACTLLSDTQVSLPPPLREPSKPLEDMEVIAGKQQDKLTQTQFTSVPAAPRGVTVTNTQSSEQLPNFKKNQPATINFEGVPLPAFMNEVFGNLLGLSFQIDNALKDKNDLVTLRITDPQLPAQIYRIARKVLDSYGIGIAFEGEVLHFLPSDKAPSSGEPPLLIQGSTLPDVPLSHRTVFQFVPLTVVRNTQVAGFLRGVQISPQLQSSEDPERNAILLSGPPAAVKQALEIIRFLDQPFMRGYHIFMAEPAFVNADQLATNLFDVLRTEGYAANLGAPAGMGASIVILPIKTSNLLVIFAASQDTLRHSQEWIAKLDSPNRLKSETNIFMYPVKNLQSQDLEALLMPMLGQIQEASPNPAKNPADPALAAPRAATATATGNLGKLVVDRVRNMLIFQGRAEEWARLLPVLKAIDRPTKQVLVEVTIAEITLTDNESFGIEWALGGLNLGSNASARSGLQSGANGLSYMLVNSLGETRAVLSALASNKRINVISSPRLMVKSGETASISVGDQVPIITTRSVDQSGGQTQGTSNIMQNIQYRKTGTVMSITPIVYAGNRVDIEVNQSVSRAIPDSSGTIGSPTINDRSIETKLALTDGGSVLLGGLIEATNSVESSGIPVLKDLPILGHLFRSDGHSVERRELIMLIVPYIVHDDYEAQQLTRAFSDSLQLEGIIMPSVPTNPNHHPEALTP